MGETMNMEQQLPQFIHQVVDCLLTIDGIVAIAILDEIERELSQWYGDRRLTM
jgi:hypothetical protein